MDVNCLDFIALFLLASSQFSFTFDMPPGLSPILPTLGSSLLDCSRFIVLWSLIECCMISGLLEGESILMFLVFPFSIEGLILSVSDLERDLTELSDFF